MKSIIAIDTETDLLGPGNVAPKLICLSAACYDPDLGKNVAVLYGNAESDKIIALMESVLEDDDVLLVFHNAAFDLTVLARAFPHLISLIFAKLERGHVTDTKIRQKLLNLSTHGKLDMLVAPDGSSSPIRYRLADLVLDYTGHDRMAEKEGEDIWRLHYDQLDGMVADDYPQEAQDYAMQDALDTLEVHALQAERIQGETGVGSVKTAEFHTAVDFALRLQSCWGFAIDQEEVGKVSAMLDAELSPEKLDLLIRDNILVPGEGPRPYANGAKMPDGSPKMTQGTADSISAGTLREHVRAVCVKNGLEVKMTSPSKKFPDGQVAIGKEVYMALAPLDPLLGQYRHRAVLNKLVTDYMPKLMGASAVHPEYDVLKETGRTSSYASKLYPSCNIQQVDPRVRQCFVARPGHVLCSVDYSAIELASFAQKCYTLFGYSVHRDKINEGIDLHAYLGAQLALRLDDKFHCDATPDDAYRELLDMPEDYYDHWRTLAKPTGLGLPGGMGVDTFREMARVAYGVTIDPAMGEEMKRIWFETYPETRDFFNWVNRELPDPNNPDLYAYFSPFGMYRAGATYCAAANGAGLQTPTAEGAKSAVFNVARACYDPAAESILFGCRPLAFIHDQLIVEVPEGDEMHAQADAVSDIMIESMRVVIPDVRLAAEPLLMRRWDKKAKPVFGEDGKLKVWEPTSTSDRVTH